MFRKELPRIYELRDLIGNPAPPAAYFRDLDRTLAEIPQKLMQYRDIEADLQGLDPAAWGFLKMEVAPLLTAKDSTRGWQPLFDRLNQAKAYNYLKRAGYDPVEFIPPSVVKGQRTPDLLAQLADIKTLCEVKTINMSEVEATRRSAGGVGASTDQLDIGFFTKLDSDLRQAKRQTEAYDASLAVKRIAYIIVNFDDQVHEYSDRYQLQIAAHLQSNNPTPDIQVVFDIKPAFYGAMK